MSPEARAPRRGRAVRLPERPEPDRLRVNLRHLAAEDPARARREAPRRLAAAYLRGWGSTLAAAGMSTAEFRRAIAGAEREVWLWVMGDRPFDQLDATIRGRAARRVPAASPPGALNEPTG